MVYTLLSGPLFSQGNGIHHRHIFALRPWGRETKRGEEGSHGGGVYSFFPWNCDPNGLLENRFGPSAQNRKRPDNRKKIAPNSVFPQFPIFGPFLFLYFPGGTYFWTYFNSYFGPKAQKPYF